MPTSRKLNRRDMLKSLGAGTAGFAAVPFLSQALFAADAAPSAVKKKVLFFTKSSGFQHSAITRKSEAEPAFAEQLLTEFGAATGLR